MTLFVFETIRQTCLAAAHRVIVGTWFHRAKIFRRSNPCSLSAVSNNRLLPESGIFAFLASSPVDRAYRPVACSTKFLPSLPVGAVYFSASSMNFLQLAAVGPSNFLVVSYSAMASMAFALRRRGQTF